MKRLPVFVAVVMLLGLVGCGSSTPLKDVYAARQTYTASLDGLTTAINAGVIKDRQTLLAIRDVRHEIESSLDDAEAKAVAGDKIGAKFVLDHVATLLEKYFQLQKKPTTRPVSLMENPAWTPQRSSRLSSVEPKPSPRWAMPLRPSILAMN